MGLTIAEASTLLLENCTGVSVLINAQAIVSSIIWERDIVGGLVDVGGKSTHIPVPLSLTRQVIT